MYTMIANPSVTYIDIFLSTSNCKKLRIWFYFFISSYVPSEISN